jgi:hypothetical protein
MKGSRWERVEELYHAALERSPEERAAFLQQACAGDEELLGEVNSLLRYEDDLDDFMERPAAEAAMAERPDAHWSPSSTPQGAGGAPTPGHTPRRPDLPTLFAWGDLEVLELIGEGGFGEVYRAWDTRLEREVALKLLQASRSESAESRASVVREGRILARIKNPHVVTVHGADDRDGRVGIWMELLRGRSLKPERELLPAHCQPDRQP